VTKDDLSRLEELLYFTGIEILEDYEPTMLARFPTSSTRFILGRQAIQRKDYKKAFGLMDKVHPDHRYYPESQLLLAQVYDGLKNKEGEFAAYDRCQVSAEKQEKKAASEKIGRYFRMVYEICLVNRARHHYKAGNYQAAIDAYNKIPKRSYKWPYIILEKAWAYYMLGDFNRTLGLLVTYKSPLLDTYFFPEAEYLTALAYFRLCLYDDTLTIINQYYQFYRPRFQALEAVLRKHKSTPNYFYNLMFRPGEELKKHETFTRQIVTRMKKQTRFSLDFNSIYKINQEMKRILREKKAIQHKLMPHLASVRENMVTKINYNAKTDIFDFLQSVPFFSSELFKVNLEVLSRKKDLVYSGKKLIADRGRGDFSNVQRTRFEEFWKFHGAFWADELGDYSFGLKSNCQTIRTENLSNEESNSEESADKTE
jgi:tetratricopeptide (TPR) repeat protein